MKDRPMPDLAPDVAEIERQLKLHGGAMDHALIERAVPLLIARVKELESVVHAMARDIEPLATQGEDYIWRPVTRACKRASAAVPEAFT